MSIHTAPGTRMEINGKSILIEGKIPRIAKLDPWFQQEWFEDVENPEVLIDALRKSLAKSSSSGRKGNGGTTERKPAKRAARANGRKTADARR